MSLQAKAVNAPALGIYVHVPFCATTCDFCAFYQEAPDRASIQRYLKAMDAEMRWRVPDRWAETIFWGGGTPGLLPARDLESLGRSLLSVLPRPPAEWTVEMAPSTVKPDKIRVLKDLGVSRISMGVQSFDDEMLSALGRQHSRRQVLRAIEIVRNADFDNLNLDLIFAVPGQSLGEWKEDLREAIAIGPEHLSTYCLTFEEDTKLWVRLQRGQVRRRSEDDEAAFYETSGEVLESAGYAQYEISNFARPGFACLHNIHTWRMQEWIGYGPSASSQWHGRRFTQVASLDEWMRSVSSRQPVTIDDVVLTPTILAVDAVVFGLRMNAGVPVQSLRERFPDAPWKVFATLANQLSEEGLLEIGHGHWGLTPAGRLLADRIGTEFLLVAD